RRVERDAEIVACALCVQGADTLYGRHWGCSEEIHSLHFETCYYQGIAYCIDQGLARFDAGTQGGHKLMRGFEPVLTYSLHWLAEPRLHEAVADFLQRERAVIESGRERLAAEHSAYRQPESEAAGANAR
ncbi:MAG: peptidogalycan biosysnthesis protein, partial [Algiphilus sp.]